jgi:hypothetical protein
MAPRFFTILTGRKLPHIRQPRPHDGPPSVNEGAVSYFAGILERMGILKPDSRRPDEEGQD